MGLTSSTRNSFSKIDNPQIKNNRHMMMSSTAQTIDYSDNEGRIKPQQASHYRSNSGGSFMGKANSIDGSPNFNKKVEVDFT